MSRFKALPFLAVFLSLTANAANGTAVLVPARRPASDRSPAFDNANESYLKDTQKNLDSEGISEFNASLFDQKQMGELKQQYENMERKYQIKDDYKLSDRSDQEAQGARNDERRSMVNSMRLSLQHYQVSKNLKTIRRNAEKDPNIRAMEKPVGVVAGIYAFYNGTPINLDLSSSTKLSARTEVPNQKGELSVTSPLINSAFAVQGKASDPNDPTKVDPTQTDEKYKLSVSRPLTWDISSALTYGSSTSTMLASMARPVAPNLTCQVESVFPVGNRSVASSEDRIKFLYGISF